MPPSLVRVAGVVAAIAVVAAGLWWLWLRPRPVVEPAAPETAASPYLNTRPGVAYVGSAVCVGCHDKDHASYLKTGMSRSAAPAAAPGAPDGTFEHAASGRRFEVRRVDGTPRHREFLLDPARADAVLTDLPVAFALGSGRHAQTFACDADGFLAESPVTWYASRQGWGMSPGYDKPVHRGFERPIGPLCVYCHMGRVERLDRSTHKYRVVEAAIGCERCHGPGELHVSHWQDTPGEHPARDGPGDLTVVNPRRLPRALAEAVCQQCHLAGDTFVSPPGRTIADYRPGLPLEDFHVVFSLVDPDRGMTVTGHVEQMHQSKCYQRSGTLTCATCHNPHGFPDAAGRAAHFRGVCLTCHTEAACKSPPAARRAADPENGCVHCHMPTGRTDIPHVAFSHHRVGIHTDAAPPPPPRGSAREVLEPFHDLSRFGESARKRALGIAYTKGGAHTEIGPAARDLTRRGRDLLAEAWDAGARDSEVAASLAVTGFRLGLPDARAYAEAALKDAALDPEPRTDALFLLGDDAYRRGDYAAAADHFRELTRIRRTSADWSYLARCELARGRRDEALRLFETAASIGSMNPRLRSELVDLLERGGDRDRAARHRRLVP
ncbi:tetratricopeptide repeat protein [Urbifossiella limnaea]|uniref:Tetratricopeptide repeat protein n=1 Tax=Urbifossiella limnaea TaxID=2528023 RepID=A0A517XQD4_9BACT|nr:tetratricopeptide repeat protein [Urbifossiella limnaea]QDU19717.1 Tetratricopeptide repeat protein [Urbifossiella limnaea]